jgi:hypothetical protein
MHSFFFLVNTDNQKCHFPKLVKIGVSKPFWKDGMEVWKKIKTLKKHLMLKSFIT